MHHIADRLREPKLHIYIGITRQRYQGIRVSLQCLSGVMSEGAVLATTVGGCSHHNTKRMYPKAPMATPNCSTVGQSNCSRQDGVIMRGLR